MKAEAEWAQLKIAKFYLNEPQLNTLKLQRGQCFLNGSKGQSVSWDF
jgi:hypothetical protein